MSTSKGYKGLAMEGSIARWYAKNRGTASQRAQWAEQAREVTVGLPEGARILEVAPGPGYFAIELARLGRYQVIGLDISRTFIEIARENATRAGVAAEFREGNASATPFADASFDLVVCQAAFKNFSEPVKALDEMHRVLRPGGSAIVHDLRKDATGDEVRQEVATMQLSAPGALMTRGALRMLRRRAYSRRDFERMARESAFGGCEVRPMGVGQEIRLRRRAR